MKRSPIRRMSNKRRADLARRAAIRDVVFVRDNFTCRLRLAALLPIVGFCSGPLTPHHVQKASDLGEYTVENLVTLCAFHNGLMEDQPRLAYDLGMVVRSWEDGADAAVRRSKL